jgi:hypothetical protein
MDKTISLILEVTPRDYANAADALDKRHFLLKYNFTVLPAAVFLVFVVIIYLMADAQQINVSGLILFSLIPALMLWVALLVLNHFSSQLVSRRMKKVISSSPLIQGTLRVNFTDQGIEFLRELTESKLNWRVFTKAVESEREFLLYWGDNQEPFFIPKRAFNSAEDLNFVRCLMRAKLAAKAEF